MYRDKSKDVISVYMLCYVKTKFIYISSVIVMYRTVFCKRYVIGHRIINTQVNNSLT